MITLIHVVKIREMESDICVEHVYYVSEGCELQGTVLTNMEDTG